MHWKRVVRDNGRENCWKTKRVILLVELWPPPYLRKTALNKPFTCTCYSQTEERERDGWGIGEEGGAERKKMERDMGWDEEIMLFSRADGGRHSFLLLAHCHFTHDGRPFGGTRSFQHRHSHFFCFRHRLQLPCMLCYAIQYPLSLFFHFYRLNQSFCGIFLELCLLLTKFSKHFCLFAKFSNNYCSWAFLSSFPHKSPTELLSSPITLDWGGLYAYFTDFLNSNHLKDVLKA